MREYFILSRWWDHLMGFWLMAIRRPRCSLSPFEPGSFESTTRLPD